MSPMKARSASTVRVGLAREADDERGAEGDARYAVADPRQQAS